MSSSRETECTCQPLAFSKDSRSQVSWQKHNPWVAFEDIAACLGLNFWSGTVLGANHTLNITCSFHPGSQGLTVSILHHTTHCTSSLELQPSKSMKILLVRGTQPPPTPGLGVALRCSNKNNYNQTCSLVYSPCFCVCGGWLALLKSTFPVVS